MSTAFPGFPSEAITFFRGLARNNNRDWFLPRKPLFEEKVKRPMWELVEALNASMKEFAPNYVTDPAKAIYRFYRDTRFSKDKSPYKDHIAASFPHRTLVSDGAAGYYVALSHKNVGVGGGIYMTVPATLLAVRNHIAQHPAEFRKLVDARGVRALFGEMQGEQLSRVPKGFAKDHPAEDLLRRKQFLWYAELPVELATTKELFGEVKKRFRAMAPFMDFLNAPLLNTQKKTKEFHI
ncbi:MAG TPA: DUF2461 domain-containing protein [Bryobacteraceae bacterium]|nr:DUF2461 domain-containing protein [Bryobacteraceae bacterium]